MFNFYFKRKNYLRVEIVLFYRKVAGAGALGFILVKGLISCVLVLCDRYGLCWSSALLLDFDELALKNPSCLV